MITKHSELKRALYKPLFKENPGYGSSGNNPVVNPEQTTIQAGTPAATSSARMQSYQPLVNINETAAIGEPINSYARQHRELTPYKSSARLSTPKTLGLAIIAAGGFIGFSYLKSSDNRHSDELSILTFFASFLVGWVAMVRALWSLTMCYFNRLNASSQRSSTTYQGDCNHLKTLSLAIIASGGFIGTYYLASSDLPQASLLAITSAIISMIIMVSAAARACTSLLCYLFSLPPSRRHGMEQDYNPALSSVGKEDHDLSAKELKLQNIILA